MTTAQEKRGLHWFNALAGNAQSIPGLPASLRVADGELAGQAVRYLAVIADANNPLPLSIYYAPLPIYQLLKSVA